MALPTRVTSALSLLSLLMPLVDQRHQNEMLTGRGIRPSDIVDYETRFRHLKHYYCYYQT